MVFVGLRKASVNMSYIETVGNVTHIWQSAVAADSNLGLVGVDEDPRVSVRATTTVAGYHTVVSPVDGLLVNELDGRVGLGL